MSDRIEIPEDLKGLYEMARTDTEPYAPSSISRLIERIARASARVKELKAENARLKAPVSRKEFLADYENSVGVREVGLTRRQIDALIAARAKEPTQ